MAEPSPTRLIYWLLVIILVLVVVGLVLNFAT